MNIILNNAKKIVPSETIIMFKNLEKYQYTLVHLFNKLMSTVYVGKIIIYSAYGTYFITASQFLT